MSSYDSCYIGNDAAVETAATLSESYFSESSSFNIDIYIHVYYLGATNMIDIGIIQSYNLSIKRKIFTREF